MLTIPRLGIIAATLTAVACGSSTAPGQAETFGGSATALAVTVTMPGELFSPNHVDIAQGGVVTFTFPSVQHDVRFGGNASAPADILTSSNTSVNRTFTNKGTFGFICTLHANMTGTVIVH
jgi:plastocyanin